MEDNRTQEIRKEIGTHMIAMSGSALHAVLNEDLDWDEALTAWQDVFADARYIAEHPETTEDEKTRAYENLRKSIYGMGRALYEMEEYEQAEEILQSGVDGHLTDGCAEVLLGLCCIRTKNPTKAFQFLRILEQNPELELDIKTKHLAWMTLASFYRTGKDGNIIRDNDIEAAYRCTAIAANIPELPEEVLQLTIRELSKYRKGIFGGYTYKG